MLKKAVVLFLFLLVYRTVPVWAEHEKEFSSAILTPGVKEEMLDAQFWLQQCDDPKEILWTREEIEQFNQKLLNTEGLAYNIFNSKFQSSFRSELSDYKKLMIGSQTIKQWDELKYGICVSRAAIKAFPMEKNVGKDPFFDENLRTTARVNTPVLIDGQTENGQYYHVIAYDCQGWTRFENIALCSEKEVWEQIVFSAGFKADENEAMDGDADENADKNPDTSIKGKKENGVLTVRVPGLRWKETGELLTMGTRLRLLTTEEIKELFSEEDFYGYYAAELPGRTVEGKYLPNYGKLSKSDTVFVEYLDFTRENLLKQMFLYLGQVYGWGGSQESVDCSGLVQDVMASFGILFPRNSSSQRQVGTDTIHFDVSMETEERKEILDFMEPGDLLYFPGHIMFYMGKYGAEYYVLNAVSSMQYPGEENDIQNIRQVVINTLSVERKDGSSWLENLETAVLFF